LVAENVSASSRESSVKRRSESVGRPLRITHYYPRALVGDGGCTWAVRGWAAALAAAGADVTVGYDAEGELPDPLVRWEQVPHRGRQRLRAPVSLEFVVEEADLLVLHSGWVYHNARASKLALRTGTPYILTPHGAYDPNVMHRRAMSKQLWWRLVERSLIDRALGIHVFFDGERDYLRNLGYTGPFIVAPTGLSAPTYAEPDRARGSYLLWMGRFDLEHKGIDLLLHALSVLPADLRPPTLLRGPDWRGGKARAIRMIRELGLAGSVHVGPPAYDEQKWALMQGARLFVFPSRWESFGIIALEAAAMGLPILATDTTFLGRALAAQGAALLSKPDPNSIASGITTGWSPSAAPLGRRAAQVARDDFSWPHAARSFLDQVESIL